jgi:hypothetical protein
MTMHLEGPWLTTSATKRAKFKMTKAKQAELDQRWRERNAYLKSMGMPKQTFEEFLGFVFGKEPKSSEPKRSVPALFQPKKPYIDPSRDTSRYLSLNGGVDTAAATKSAAKVYTGTKVKGIGTMHKSNAVPIFSDEDAVAIASMRR